MCQELFRSFDQSYEVNSTFLAFVAYIANFFLQPLASVLLSFKF